MKILIADIGSTTTKAFLFSEDGKLLSSSIEATTVEKPFEDVKIGLFRTINNIEEQTGLSLCSKDNKINNEVNLLLTSSAGGGLEMAVVGLTDLYSAKIGEKSAQGSGAIVSEVICGGDGRDIEDRIELLKNISPDMVLFVGGTNSDYITNTCFYAELLKNAKIHNKYKHNPIPIIYAGNENAINKVSEILHDYPLFIIKNICEEFKLHDISELKKKVGEIFFKHVIEDSPGYAPLKLMTKTPILPTPIAVTNVMEILKEKYGNNILLFDIGGATTDIFTLYNGKFNRSVCANIGMSYSIDNVLKLAGLKNIMKLLPKNFSPDTVMNYIGNKKLNPTTLALTDEQNKIETAVAINGIRLALRNHFDLYEKDFEGTAGTVFKRLNLSRKLTFNHFLQTFDAVIGSGGIVSNNSSDNSKEIILKATQRKTIPNLFLDRGFMFPHIGVFSNINKSVCEKILFQYSLLELNNPEEKIFDNRNQKTEKQRIITKINNQEIIINITQKNTLKVGSRIKMGQVLFEHREKVYRHYSIPIPLNKSVTWLPETNKFKKNEKLVRVQFKTGYDEIFTCTDGELLELRDYAIMFRESDDFDLMKIKLYIPGFKKNKSNQHVLKKLDEKYPQGIIGQSFKQNSIIISSVINHYYQVAPISGRYP